MGWGEVGRKEEVEVLHFKSSQGSTNSEQTPDRKPEVFNYNSSPEKISYLPTPCLCRWEVSGRRGVT